MGRVGCYVMSEAKTEREVGCCTMWGSANQKLEAGQVRVRLVNSSALSHCPTTAVDCLWARAGHRRGAP